MTSIAFTIDDCECCQDTAYPSGCCCNSLNTEGLPPDSARLRLPRTLAWTTSVPSDATLIFGTGYPQQLCGTMLPATCDAMQLVSGTWVMERVDGTATDYDCEIIGRDSPCTYSGCEWAKVYNPGEGPRCDTEATDTTRPPHPTPPPYNIITCHGYLEVIEIRAGLACDYSRNKLVITCSLIYNCYAHRRGCNSGLISYGQSGIHSATFEADVVDWTTLACADISTLDWLDVTTYTPRFNVCYTGSEWRHAAYMLQGSCCDNYFGENSLGGDLWSSCNGYIAASVIWEGGEGAITNSLTF